MSFKKRRPKKKASFNKPVAKSVNNELYKLVKEHERRLKKLKQVVIVSDTHAGCKLGLCSDNVYLDESGSYKPSRFQKRLYQFWLEFWNEWVPLATRGEDFAVIHNGDVIDGVHHGATTLITNNLTDQRAIAYDLLRPVVHFCNGLYFQIRGTEAHVGKSAQEEEELARALGAIPERSGNASRYDLWLNIGDHLIHTLHHVSSCSSSAYEATAVHKELVDSLTEAARWGYRPPDAVIRCLSQDCQVLTPYGWKYADELSVGSEVITLNLKDSKLVRDCVQDKFVNEQPEEVIDVKLKPHFGFFPKFPVSAKAKSAMPSFKADKKSIEKFINNEKLCLTLTPDHTIYLRKLSELNFLNKYYAFKARELLTSDNKSTAYLLPCANQDLSGFTLADKVSFGIYNELGTIAGIVAGCCASWDFSIDTLKDGKQILRFYYPGKNSKSDLFKVTKTVFSPKMGDIWNHIPTSTNVDDLTCDDLSSSYFTDFGTSFTFSPDLVELIDRLLAIDDSVSFSDYVFSTPKPELFKVRFNKNFLNTLIDLLLPQSVSLYLFSKAFVTGFAAACSHAQNCGRISTRVGQESFVLWPVNQELAATIQMFGVYTGAGTFFIDKLNTLIYRPYFNSFDPVNDLSFTKSKQFEKTWCVKTTTGTLIARQNGLVLILGNSHRHRYVETAVMTKRGRAIGVVTPSWQGKTPYVWKLTHLRVAPPQFGGLLVRSDKGRLFVDSRVWIFGEPEIETGSFLQTNRRFQSWVGF